MMKNSRTLLAAALAVVGTSAFAADADKPGAGVSIKPAVATWTSAIPVNWVYVELLEELGYDVEKPVPLSNPVAYLAIAEGDADYWSETWIPLHEPQFPANFRDVATIFPAHCSGCGIEGYLVDKASIDKYEITGIEDFKRDDVRAAFDANGDGRADLFGCPPGWGCHENINKMIEKFDLGDYINHVDADYAANFAEALSRIEAGESALYYTWGPSAWVNKLVPGTDVMWVNAPGIVSHEEELASGISGAVSDPIYMGAVVGDIAVAANTGFLNANPAAAELFRQVRLPFDWINQADATMNSEGLSDEDVRKLSQDWIKENRLLVDGWLDAARAAAG
ncbi:MAG: glycine betaine/L-proline ABC transporter substrate-binding protein ProX [Albidovulum sp.]